MSLASCRRKFEKRVTDSLDRVDSMAHIRNALRDMGDERDDFSGCPMPLEGERLVIESTFKYAGLSDIGKPKEDEGVPRSQVRNIFWSSRLRARVAICEDENGRIYWGHLTGSGNQATAILRTIGCSEAWGIEQEANATQLLGTLLRHRQFKQYLLTGSFIESSPRSGVTYIFRRLRPTIAIKGLGDDTTRILCTLCMHPIGYYEESWAGCMCPTDDLIAHLVLMRGDEKMFWRRCNQHSPEDPASGL